MDTDGYGYEAGEDVVQRLLEDLRTLSPAGIERVAHGWEVYGQSDQPAYEEAEKAALAAIEAADLATSWGSLRRELLDLTEGRASLVAWKAEHGEVGHRGEAAALGAALALQAGNHLDVGHRRVLLRSMAEALPWLLASEDT